MPVQLSDGRVAVRTVLIERKAGREHVLFERPGRCCHFAEDIVHGQYIISLRVDWRDLWESEPTLDADIYVRGPDGRKGRRVRNQKWHHTRLDNLGPGDVRAYSFKFKDLDLELVARKSLAVTAGLSAYIVNEDSTPL